MQDTVAAEFTEDDAQFVQALGEEAVTLLYPIPELPDLEQAWQMLSQVLRVHSKAEDITLKLRPMIGKLLEWAKNHPEFYQRKGYPRFKDFIKEFVVRTMKLGKSSLYQAKMLAERLPSLTPQQYVELGPTKAGILASYARDTDPSYPEYLEAARAMSAVNFERWSVEHGLIEAGQHEATSIAFISSKIISDQWDAFKVDPIVHARVGTGAADRIFEAMMQECAYWFGDPERQAICQHCNGTGRESE